MCGIFGAINVCISDRTENILSSLNKRGPDGYGVFEDKAFNTTLIHTRLSIIDTSISANQPMEYGNWVITYNGEIYNYLELRNELVALGYTFKTHSDTEVVLVAFQEWNEKCLRKFRGMFAFGIWNKNTKKLFAARDYLGIKPFYYQRFDEGFIFSSLLTSLLASGRPSKRVNLKGMVIFLQTGSFTSDQTIIQGIQQLPPAHYLTFENGNLNITQYWNITDEAKKVEKPIDYRDAVRQVRSKLEKSAHYQMVADVSVGAFLSSGIDSCISVGLMSQFSSYKLNTFTVGFETKFNELNELEGARLISKRYGTNHHELIIDDETISENIDDYVRAMDQPSIDGLNTYLVSKETSRFTKVAVSGLGSDEIFGGYSHFIYAAVANQISPRGITLNKNLFRTLNILPAKYKQLLKYIFSAPTFRNQMVRNYGELHPVLIKLNSFHKENLKQIISDYYFDNSPKGLDAVQQLSFWEINKYLSNTLLRDADALSMSQGLEVRPLFLDHDLVSYVFGLKGNYKVNFTFKKRVLIDACRDLLPPEIYNKKKTGFELPLKSWLQTNLKPDFLNLINSASTLNLFSSEYIYYLKHSIEKGEVNNAHWAVYICLKFINIHELETCQNDC